MILYPNRMHVVTVEGTGINKMADLKGKRVSTGSPGSATEVMAFRVIEAAGLDKDKDMKRERLGVAESVNAIKDSKIDAFFWVGGLPTAAVTDLATTPGTKIKMIDHAELVPAMNKKYGNLYVQDTIPKDTYRGMAADNKQATVMNILVAHEKMDDKTAYNIVKTIFDKREDLIAVHKEAEPTSSSRTRRRRRSPVPFHPGAREVLQREGRQAQLRAGISARATCRARRLPAGEEAMARRLRRDDVVRSRRRALQQAPRSTSRKKKARQPARRLARRLRHCWSRSVMSLFHLYAAYAIVPTHSCAPVHVAFVLFAVLPAFPVAQALPPPRHVVGLARGWRRSASSSTCCRAATTSPTANTSPNTWDIVFGVALIVLVLEAMRRTTGWIMPVICTAFILPTRCSARTCRRRGRTRATRSGAWSAHMYMTLEGIFGVAVDVSSSLIILFTIFGAFLQYSGAGKFFIDFSFSAMGGKPTGAGRTVVLASFLLGGPSGSGVATTVTLGSVAYPMLAKAGYDKDAAGGLLAAGGLGAIISPPVLGAAAFLIAEFLKISYLDVLLMASIPTLLFYLALFLMVEIDARKFGMRDVARSRSVETVLESDAAILVPLPVAGLDRRLHADGLLAGAVGVLGDGRWRWPPVSCGAIRALIPYDCCSAHAVLARHLRIRA